MTQPDPPVRFTCYHCLRVNEQVPTMNRTVMYRDELVLVCTYCETPNKVVDPRA